MSFDEDFDRPPVTFVPAGDDDEAREKNLALVEPSPGYFTSSVLIAEAIVKRSTITVLDYSANQVAVRFQIDGVWHAGEVMDRETGDYLLATLKQIAGMDYRERRARQTGSFATAYLKAKQKIRVVSQGIATGERVALYLSWKEEPKETVDQLGMRESMQTQLKEMVRNDDAGIIMVSAKPGEGYTSAWRGVLDACDRLTRDYFVIEEKSMVEPEVINFGSITFDQSKQETAMTPIPQLLLRQPNVLAFNNVPSGELLNSICDLSNEQDMPMFIRGPGRNCIDAVLRILALKPDAKKFGALLNAVVCMRSLRLLCDQCKIGYAPHPKLLEKLSLPPSRIKELYRPMVFKPGMLDENEEEIQPCKTCSGIGYQGRTGIFELLNVNDKMKSAIAKKSNADTLKDIAQANRHVTMTQEGALLVAQGRTSAEELQRVLTSK